MVQQRETTAVTIERYLGLPFQSIELPDSHRIIRLQNVYGSGDKWPSLTLANHNVFRLNGAEEVVWQVWRDDKGHMNWDYINREAQAEDPGCEGYFDPFQHIYLLGCSTPQAGKGRSLVWQPGFRVYLNTRWWTYLLDIDTGVATCTGDQLK